MIFNPLEKKTYSEKIANQIQARILTGELRKGEKLPSEMEMAENFQVSRSVVREAMRILEGLGLISVKKGPKGGIFAANGYHKPLSNSLKGLVDSGQVTKDNINKVRMLLEPFVASEAAIHADDDDIKTLEALLNASRKKMNDAGFLQANRGKFHIHLATASKNPVIEMFMKSLIELLREYFIDFKDVEFEKRAIISHEKILKAIIHRSPEHAKRLMEKDIMEIKALSRGDR